MTKALAYDSAVIIITSIKSILVWASVTNAAKLFIYVIDAPAK
jgi:hypothetical protein